MPRAMKPERNSSPETLAEMVSVLPMRMPGNCLAMSALTWVAAVVGSWPARGLNRTMAEWPPDPNCWTWGSDSPVFSIALRRSPMGAWPGVVTWISVPPEKSMPRFRPWAKNEAQEASMASADRPAANGASRTKSMCVLLGR